MSALTILAATNNAHKLVEFRRILGPLGIALVRPSDLGVQLEVEETGQTFAENAELKARAFAEASGLTALADDSGLVVEALGGAPGIRSARYGGPGLDDRERTQLVLDALRGVPEEERGARFVAVIALVNGPGPAARFEGAVEGRIAHQARGANGFGYDPIFYFPPFARTFGECSAEEKDRVSHRAQALAKLAAYVADGGNLSILGLSNGDGEC